MLAFFAYVLAALALAAFGALVKRGFFHGAC